MAEIPELPDKGLTHRGRMLLEEFIDYLKATKPVAGIGISLREVPNGTQISSHADATTSTAGDVIVTRMIVGGVATDVNLLKRDSSA